MRSVIMATVSGALVAQIRPMKWGTYRSAEIRSRSVGVAVGASDMVVVVVGVAMMAGVEDPGERVGQ
jgi:hypothetical protein